MVSPIIGTTGDENYLRHNIVMEHRKRRRMLSNRQSARRCRVRKQKHLDDLTAHLAQLRAENNHILSKMNSVTQLYLATESHNSVLRAQLSELIRRVHALNHIANPSFNIVGQGFAVELGH